MFNSVSHIAKTYKQPYGGYVRPRDFEVISFQDGKTLYSQNNGNIGMVVDYLTRFLHGASLEEAFFPCLKGAENLSDSTRAKEILSEITGTDYVSIKNAYKLTCYDYYYRTNVWLTANEGENDTCLPLSEPTENEIESIQIMMDRVSVFLDKYGPITHSGMTFDRSAFTHEVSSADADFMTANTLWELKTKKLQQGKHTTLSTKHTLQLVMYYLLGLHSTLSEDFYKLKNIGVFNPWENVAYIQSIDMISDRVLNTIARDVMGYDDGGVGFDDNEIQLGDMVLVNAPKGVFKGKYLGSFTVESCKMELYRVKLDWNNSETVALPKNVELNTQWCEELKNTVR